MAMLPEVIVLDAEEEAARLWQGAQAALEEADRSLVALCEGLDLGVRTAEILVIQRLQAARDQFPATIGLQLELPVAEVEAYRDAVTVPKALQFGEILDLLSGEGLECVAPRMHRGWEDRRFSCGRSRTTAQEAIGLSLAGDERERLLLLAAYRNRLFRYPPPIRVVPGEILAAIPDLKRLVEHLLAG